MSHLYSMYGLCNNIFPLLLSIVLALMSTAHIMGVQVILAQINMAQIKIYKMSAAQMTSAHASASKVSVAQKN